jgi:hypothetical protein
VKQVRRQALVTTPKPHPTAVGALSVFKAAHPATVHACRKRLCVFHTKSDLVPLHAALAKPAFMLPPGIAFRRPRLSALVWPGSVKRRLDMHTTYDDWAAGADFEWRKKIAQLRDWQRWYLPEWGKERGLHEYRAIKREIKGLIEAIRML